MSTQHVRGTAVFPDERAGVAAPPHTASNAIRFGPRTRRAIRAVARAVNPLVLTFSNASHWYQNIRSAGWCVITYQGTDHAVAEPVVVDRATAGPAYPRYERLALRLIGIDEFVWLPTAVNRS